MSIARIAVFLLWSTTILWWFLSSAGGGIHAYFTSDDLANMCLYEEQPPLEAVWSNIVWFTPAYRPAGGLFYRPLFAAFGLNALPFRLVCFALLGLNIAIAWLLVRRVTGSAEAAAVSTLIFCYHPRFVDLYWSSGTVYDIACFTFFFAALFVYAGRGTKASLPRAAAVIVLYICALNSKEMAVALAPLLLAYELIYSPPEPREWRRWLRHRMPLPVITGIMALPYVWGKLLALASPLNQLDRYHPRITVDQFLTTYGGYLDPLFYASGWFTPVRTAIFLLATLVLAALLRSKHLAFAWCIAVITALPIAFIPARTAFAFYMPLLGWTMYAGVAITSVAVMVSRRMPDRFTPVRQVLLWAVVFLLVFRAHRVQRLRMGGPEVLSQHRIRLVVDELRARRISFSPDTPVTVINDPFGTSGHELAMLLRLYARAPGLKLEHAASPADAGSGVLLRWQGTQLECLRGCRGSQQ